MNNEIEGLQRELTKIKTHNQSSSIQLSTKVDALKIEYVSSVRFVSGSILKVSTLQASRDA